MNNAITYAKALRTIAELEAKKIALAAGRSGDFYKITPEFEERVEASKSVISRLSDLDEYEFISELSCNKHVPDFDLMAVEGQKELFDWMAEGSSNYHYRWYELPEWGDCIDGIIWCVDRMNITDENIEGDYVIKPYYDFTDTFMYGGYRDRKFRFGDITMEYVEDYGGEGMGDDFWVVVKVTNNTTKEVKYFKHDGWYASHDGGYLEDVYEVTPKEVMKVEWEAVK